MSRCIILCLSLGLVACSGVQSDSQSIDINTFAALVEKTFETAPDNTKNIIRDRRVRVQSDALEGIWFYTQLNTGADKTLYRQRLSNVRLASDGQSIIQKTYGLKDPALYENAWESPARLSALTPNDFESYFQAGCEQVWTPQESGTWSGYVDPKTCVVTSKRRNKDIRIESEGYLSKDIFRTNERGYDMDMTFLWGTKPGEYITLYPVP